MSFLAFLFGATVGSFLNVCIARWPAETSVARPRSRCPKCEAPISWRDNIPLLSFFLLRGRCRSCRQSISWRYPLVEALNGVLWAALIAQFGWQPYTLKAALFASMMLVLIFTDIETYILPDEVTIGGAVLGLALSAVILIPAGPTFLIWMLAGREPTPAAASMLESASAALFFAGMLWALREVYYRLRGFDGLGLGDVKMAAMLGAFWGMSKTFLILIAGSLLGVVVGTLIVTLGRKRWNTEFPFGSHLGAAGLASLFLDERAAAFYWDLLGRIGS